MARCTTEVDRKGVNGTRTSFSIREPAGCLPLGLGYHILTANHSKAFVAVNFENVCVLQPLTVVRRTRKTAERPAHQKLN